jgi:hypothetical protein
MRQRLALPILVFILTVVVTVVACAQAADRPVPPTPATGASLGARIVETASAGAKTPASQTGPAGLPDALTPLSETTITIAGVVGSVDASEKLLRLDGQNEGISTIRLTLATRVVLENGKDGSFADLRAGQTVQAKGLPGKAGALIARQVTVSRGY